jgi:cellulose synthase/poly-beta-1,6-N-acetylglucosamine synthase-like glycosyltransferase
MEIFIIILFLINGFIIFWAMIGYPISLKILYHIIKPVSLKKDYSFCPSVTILVVAHNEEKVIQNKLENLKQLVYPIENLKILVSSDNSTDKTNSIVESFIKKNQEYNVKLYKVRERKGKTNAQNEAVKTVETEFVVLTDANSMFDSQALNELMASFSSNEVA